MDIDLLKVCNTCFKFKAITKTWMSSRSHLVNPFISQTGKQTQECEVICPKSHNCLVAEPRALTLTKLFFQLYQATSKTASQMKLCEE